MNTLFSEDELLRLHIDPNALGAIERLPIPEPRVDEGRGAVHYSPPVERMATSFESAEGAAELAPPAWPSARVTERLRVRSDVLEALGVDARFDERRHLLALKPPAEWPMTLSLAERPGAADRDLRKVARMDRAATVRLPLLDTFRFVIVGPGGMPLALGAIEQGELRLQPVYPWPAPPLDDWIEAVMDDQVKVLAAGRLQADRWVETTVAGVLARLQTSGTASDARARLAAMRDGRDTSPALKPRLWMRSFSPVQRDVVERFARVRARSMASRLASLLDRLTPDTPDLVEAWRTLCHERDDLEGVRVLLREAGAGGQLEEALREADATGRAARFSWPREFDVDDKRLRRVALSNPGAWWGSTRYAVYLL
jgi:hypothetical protein